MAKISEETIDNLKEFLSRGCDYAGTKEAMPKKIVCELSECKTYYNCRLYFDMVEDGKIREAFITIKAKEPSYVYDFRIIPDDDEEKTMYTITISDIDD